MLPSTILLSTFSFIATARAATYRALIHNGTGDCAGCPESIGALLSNSPYKFDVHYAGPGQEFQVNALTLSQFDVYAQGGGPDLELGWSEIGAYKQDIRDYVYDGGRYLGFCLGAYYAGQDWFDLFPNDADVGSEINSTNPQVNTTKDTVIQVDWTFSNGTTVDGRWVYFQEGAVMTGINKSNVVGRYSQNQDVAASVTPYGNGWVGLVGFHPEADQSWYDLKDISNPDGVSPEIGYDFVGQVMEKSNGTITLERVQIGLMSILKNLQ